MPAATTSHDLVFFHDADVVERSPEALGRLADAMTVQVPSYPGFEGHADDADRGWEAWDSAEDLALHFRDTLHSHHPEPVHVMGAGFGGWVALELALLAPRGLASLVLVAPYGVKLFGRMERDFEDLLLLDADEQLQRGWADPRRCRGIRMPGFPQSSDDAQHTVAFAERATLARYGWKPFMHSRRLTRWFQTIDTPTLVVSGARDRMVREGHSELLASRMPDAVHVEIPDAGHYPYLEQPERFQEAVLDFYARLEENPR
jgi:pimeloyl-ACP methyl ester carboxylesterase